MKLLQIEFKKIVGNKSFKVFGIMFLVFLPLLAILFPSMVSVDVQDEKFYLFAPTNFESSWYAINFISSWFCFFLLSFILIYHITNEYNYRTVRQNVIDGYTRSDYLKGKFYLMLTLLVFATIYVWLIGALGGLYFSSLTPKDPTVIQEFFKNMNGVDTDIIANNFGSITDGMENVLRFFVQNLGAFSLAFLAAFLVKRGILAVLLFFGTFIVSWIGERIFEANNLAFINSYLPTNAFRNSLPWPSLTSMLSGITSPESFNWLAIGLTIVYSIVFILLSKRLFFQRDIS